jgi:L-iditol 2-dehydrogenase
MFAALSTHQGCEVSLAGRGENRLALAAKLGAHPIEVRAPDDLMRNVRESGRTFDVVVEAVGVPETWEAAVRLVRKGGAVNLFGGCPSGTFVRLDTGLIHYSNLRLLASFHHMPRSIREALRLIEHGVVRARDFVDGACDLDQLPGVFREMATGNRRVKTLVRTRNARTALNATS